MHKVLIVENDGELRDNLKSILESNNFKVSSASDGKEALAKIELFNPALILSGIGVPNLNGIELYKIVEEKYKFTPFIFIIAKSDMEFIREELNLGGEDYITKPFEVDELLKSVNVRIQKKEIIPSQIVDIKDDIIKYFPHELRTPLMPILNLSEYIKTEGDNLEKNEVMEIADQILTAGHRLLNRVEKFLMFIELETLTDLTKLYNDRTSIDNDYITCLIIGNPLLSKSNQFFDIAISSAELSVHNYFLSALLKEIIENAVKFRKPDTRIKITGMKDTTCYMFEIKNIGHGMSEDEILDISVFRQFNRDINNQEGNGLGLAIAMKIVDLFTGEIHFESKKNSYMSVRICLPVNVI